MSTEHAEAQHALVIGGSLGGLFAALELRRAGWRVEVFERSPGALESRGGGIVQQAEIAEVFARAGLDPDGPVGVESGERLYLARDGSVAERLYMPQKQTSWGAMWGAMRACVPDGQYHVGKELIAVYQDNARVTARFRDGTEAAGDMLVAADGGGSTVRALLEPAVARTYAGYVAFRGLVPERELASEAASLLAERFVFYQEPGSHMLSYLVAAEDGSVAPGKRRYNWVWYRNVDAHASLATLFTDKDGRRREAGLPPGQLGAAAEHEMRNAAEAVLPPAYRALLDATREPFVQGIFDLVVPKMALGRVALLGDAAFIPRPHTAASTSKAAANALALAEALTRAGHDVPRALALWEPSQMRLGMSLYARGRSLGERSQFPEGRGPYPGDVRYAPP